MVSSEEHICVCLRPLRESDLPARSEWTADEELAALMGVDVEAEQLPPPERQLEENRSWFAARQAAGALLLAIEAEGRYIGDIDATVDPASRVAELSLFIGDRSQWGKGYGSAAASLIVRQLMEREDVDAVEVDVHPGNDRALRFWKMLGFRDCRTGPRGIVYLRRER